MNALPQASSAVSGGEAEPQRGDIGRVSSASTRRGAELPPPAGLTRSGRLVAPPGHVRPSEAGKREARS